MAIKPIMPVPKSSMAEGAGPGGVVECEGNVDLPHSTDSKQKGLFQEGNTPTPLSGSEWREKRVKGKRTQG